MISEFTAGLKVSRGEWTFDDLLAAIHADEVDPGVTPPPIENHQDWDEVEERTRVSPFMVLVHTGDITYEQQEQLADAMAEARAKV